MGPAEWERAFGPVMVVWFLVLGVLGARELVRAPEVLWAVNPFLGLRFLLESGWHGFVVIGSVFLVVTGAEALYADMGHFGIKPIRRAWFGLVLPGLVLNYLGQGALLLRDPAAAANPFYRLAPGWAQYPLVVLATAAAVIASQALISGVYSLTMQAVQLGFLPRLGVTHTSSQQRGQIYVPLANALLLLACMRAGAWLWFFQPPGSGLWDSGDADDGDHDDIVFCRRPLSMGLGAVEGHCMGGAFSGSGVSLLRSQLS